MDHDALPAGICMGPEPQEALDGGPTALVPLELFPDALRVGYLGLMLSTFEAVTNSKFCTRILQ